MATTSQSGASQSQGEPGDYLDMPSERRSLAKAHVATLSATAGRVARALPISADVDDFRRVMSERAKP